MVEKEEVMGLLGRMKNTDMDTEIGIQGGGISGVADRPISFGGKGGMRDSLINLITEDNSLICAKT
jgi:hypothetical protein